jgi:chorismate mutase / prephenate dehydratase
MSLDDLRKQIDTIDDRILSLLEERANVVSHVADAKKGSNAPYFNPERERAVLDRLSAKGAGRFPREAIRSVYREVMSACLSLQAPMVVSFLGPEGTFAHIAARHLFGLAARYAEATTIDNVFDAVRRGVAMYGVVPIENSTEGSVTSTADALIDGGIAIRQELILDISQCLLSLAPSLTSIERVYSHPQALAQCRIWLARNLSSAQLVQTTSTSAAARDAAADPTGAAIGSSLAAEIHGLPIVRESVQDRPENATRFLLLAKDDAPPTGDDKTTLAFSLRDGRGALRHALEAFDLAGVSLTRIESRPHREKAWEYVFLVDAEGHRQSEGLAKALETLAVRCETVNVLGSYPRFRSPAAPDAA